MKIKDLKKLLKEFDDEDEVLVEGVLHSAWWHADWDTRELIEKDISSSQYDWKTRMIITVY